MRNKKKMVIPVLSTALLTINNTVFATSTGIGTEEVATATANIERVITSLAMPLRWCFNFCKYCCCSN